MARPPTKAACRIRRTARPDESGPGVFAGIIAIGLTYYPEHVLEGYRQSQGSLMGTTGQIQTVADVLKLFEGKVDRIYFNHDVADPTRQGPTMVIFSVKK